MTVDTLEIPAEELARRLAATARGAVLYSTDHPIVSRGIDALTTLCTQALADRETLIVGIIGDEIVVNGERLPRSAARLSAFARELREHEIEKITFHAGVTRDEIRIFIVELAARRAAKELQTRVQQKGVRRITMGLLNLDETEAPVGMEAARELYTSAVGTASSLWNQAKAGDKPDPNAARSIIDSLAKMVTQDRTSLMALTAMKRYDDYTFTHMVNVSVLAMAQARSLGIEGPLLREFGFAALMHDIGKVQTPTEVLNKPDKLTKEEFEIMKRHVIDGADILRRTPEMPALAPVVAFEHHLRQDLSGYPENIAHRDLNLCTQVVSVADVYDALRSKRVYRDGLPSDRIRSIMTQKDSPAFNTKLLRRFINLVGMFPVGTLVMLESEEVGVVTHEHPNDPFRPQVKVLLDRLRQPLESPVLVNTWETSGTRCGVAEAVDPDEVGIDPLAHM